MSIFNAAMILVEEWTNNSILHFTGCVIIHPCLDYGQPMIVKMVPFDFAVTLQSFTPVPSHYMYVNCI